MTSGGKVFGCSGETISKYCDSGVLYLNRYLIQSEGKKQSRRSKRAERVQNFDIVSHNILNGQPVQIKGKIEFPKIELHREKR